MKALRLGIDIGSTTVKIVVLNEDNHLIYSDYRRHYSDMKNTVISAIKECYNSLGEINVKVCITGSGGLSVADWLKLSFIQEVIACTNAIEVFIPDTDVAIELGGEDAKITYFRGGIEQRMNGSCAGGTGAFIDQMATLLNTDAAGLNEYAKGYKVIYPIASRCGVFAKTDIQPLINEGAKKEDIAASIFQAVVNQTIGGLACGKPIRGRVAYLGGPLFFLSELRERFTESLKISREAAITPDNSQLFAAIGAAIASNTNRVISLKELSDRVSCIASQQDNEVKRLKPLFSDVKEYDEFKNRHSTAKIKRDSIVNYRGRVFLGIDAGSTTTKLALIGENKELLYSYYGANEGAPLNKLVNVLKELYNSLPSGVKIAKCTVTGYGESLMKAALHADYGEIETVAHYKAAKHFLPDVNFILDIGGQDMKCLRIKNGAIDSILLNEACSSGCGSFIEGFAASLNMEVNAFAMEGLFAKEPVDLGTKCTVFMNSKVRQSQKEGARISDLSAGLSYSVIKNALYKVIKLREGADLGSKIIVQGGTFNNDAILRSFELISGREAVRPDIAGLMGAYGAALISLELYKEGEITSLLTPDELVDFSMTVSNTRCRGCTNHCLLTINRFFNGEIFIAGNRCEKGANVSISNEIFDKEDIRTKIKESFSADYGTDDGAYHEAAYEASNKTYSSSVKDEGNKTKLPNLYEYKYLRTFQYKPLEASEADRGIIGIPRVLNMYENYPFWFTLFTELRFRVILSAPSSQKLYQKGLETIPSESVCYPAKLCHGHIMDLLEKGAKVIFYPSVMYEKKEYKDVTNHYNCPIVTSYPEVVKNNIDALATNDIRIMTPFLSLEDDKILVKRLIDELSSFNIPAKEIKKAVSTAIKEREQYKKDIRTMGEETLRVIRDNNITGIVLCGKPYHVDPEINHGIPGIILANNMAVLTEDSIAHLVSLNQKLRVVDQWTYNSRLYRAAAIVAREPLLEMIQLNSFGCGLDAVTSDQIAELLSGGGKMYTMLKIDEGNNLGAAKIRIRSLKAAISERRGMSYNLEISEEKHKNAVFTKAMKKVHTILAPQMAPIHFELISEAAATCGFQLEVLPAIDREAIDEGLKYVNNDACYPAVIMVGQVIKALKSGNYDINNTSVIITQSGGGCRATNYIAFLRLGLRQAGFPYIPVISVNTVGLEKQPGFKLSPGLINRSIMALLYGDLFMRVLFRTRPYERFPGSSVLLYKKWNSIAKLNIQNGSKKEFENNVRNIIYEFDNLELQEIKKPRVGIVGEILVKYHPTANNDIVSILEQGGAEAIVPDLMDYILYSAYNARFKYKYLAGKKLTMQLCSLATIYIERYRRIMKRELDASKRFVPPAQIEELAAMASPVLSLGNHTGEGWLVTAEMIELIKHGINNIICVQPLACLPNHITGKGMFKPLKEQFPQANIIPVDYDPGISSVNQLNRIKLMLSVAEKNLEK